VISKIPPSNTGTAHSFHISFYSFAWFCNEIHATILHFDHPESCYINPYELHQPHIQIQVLLYDMAMLINWVVMSSGHVSRYNSFGEIFCLHLQGWNEFICFSEAWVPTYSLPTQKTNIKIFTSATIWNLIFYEIFSNYARNFFYILRNKVIWIYLLSTVIRLLLLHNIHNIPAKSLIFLYFLSNRLDLIQKYEYISDERVKQ
jgi:hypothetical protein